MTRLRTVILGTGFGRTVQAVGFGRHGGYEIVGIAGRQLEKSRKIAEELGIPRGTDDWRALIAETKPDLVSIVSPPALHHPMMMTALEAGAHVLCEKPTALHRHQAREMRDRALALGKVAAINHEFRFLPARRLGMQMIAAGDIGAPRRATISGSYGLWTKPESRGMTWLSDRRFGGGILGALGSHHTDCLRMVFGEPVRARASVRVSQPKRGPGPGTPEVGIATADDSCTVEYEFAGGGTALIDLDATAHHRWERFEIRGAEATLRWDEHGLRLWRLAPGREIEELEIPEALRLESRDGEPALVAPFGVLAARLHRAITAGEPMEPSFDDALAVQCGLDAARLSQDSGGWVRVDSAARPAAAVATR